MKLKSIIRTAYDLLMPRFITEDVVVTEDEEGRNVPLCRVGQERDDDVIVGVISIRSFALLGWALFPKAASALRPYQ